MLVEAGEITPVQLAKAIELQKDGNERLGQVLVRIGAASEKAVGEAVAKQLGLQYVDLDDVLPEEQALLALPEHLARRYQVIPLRLNNGKLRVGMVDPLDVVALDDIRRHTGQEIETVVISHGGFQRVLPQYPALDENVQAMIQEIKADPHEELGLETLRRLVQEAPVVQLVNLIILQGLRQRASDIHIEPLDTRVRIRFRIDGTLYNIMTPPKRIQAAIISRVKIMADMDIAERRLPQDGRIDLKVEGREIDLRVSTIPTVFGEKVVMRILDKSAMLVGVEQIGLLPDSRKQFEAMIARPYGILLLTGPTGSGKTTTLYTMLSQLNNMERNIITIEDPVEYQLLGVNQVQVNPKAGLTFANGLRSFLRQDPDVIMVGEIRDEETARIAIHAALTGHLVLSTLHTNDAPGAVVRLIDMGIEPLLVASSLIGVIAQRLVRVLCDKCKQAHTPPAEVLERLGVPLGSRDGAGAIYRPVGCDFCGKIGYRGRTGIFEIMAVDEEIKALIMKHSSMVQVKKAAMKAGMRSLVEDGLAKVSLGITSVEEVVDAVSAD
ncbi:MAG: type II secretion system protein GspE [Bacillati bacterium ANGP1]|uniref:protein-secreting ATPase n=1 Tax=Candidatus Segetimicrobium genomatis TaxID=2569760 RepID=A0A537JTJ4_9BACT|nr:MAG: type II secretion system protein GspE [Terrabacteria group bacterium ANGP1]